MYGSMGLVRDRREMMRRQQFQRMHESQVAKDDNHNEHHHRLQHAHPQASPVAPSKTVATPAAGSWSFPYSLFHPPTNATTATTTSSSPRNSIKNTPEAPRPALE